MIHVRILCLAMSILWGLTAIAQSKVAITIDDVPNAYKFRRDHFEPKFLNVLDSVNIPVAIFVNEGRIYNTDSTDLNLNLLHEWCKRDYTLLANHTFAHSRYSDVGIDSFKTDIEKGRQIIQELARQYGKTLDFFRFPYNDLGKDSLQHAHINQYLQETGTYSTPFTVESSDWMYNYVYRYYLQNDQQDSAKFVAQDYIRQTLNLFEFYDSLALEIYDRQVDHIYLCHDNEINADYLPQLLESLKAIGYELSSLTEVLTDTIYSQKDVYNRKWGISWFYRWMTDPELRKKWMYAEPELDFIYKAYERLKK